MPGGIIMKDLQTIINESKKIVFFGGAGVSTESGIPDYRSKDGLYNQKFDYPPEIMLSHTFFLEHPEEFFNFYKSRMVMTSASPNQAHYKLAQLEKVGKLIAVITQNIDGLHQKAGSKNVLELHGSIYRNYCTKCNKFYEVEDVIKSEGVPYCKCGGIIKPDVVLYEEGLEQSIIDRSLKAIIDADTLIVAGTSLTVYPAAGMIQYFKGKYLVLINKTPTSMDELADLVIRDNVGKVLEKIVVK